ncbi:MAG TPA: glycosyltransferase family 2 protein [Bacteroidales bacterium]|nr:glycosyltransferase family 2 protein [Bacteroidales bacterium]
MKDKISIICVTLNAESTIERTIQSVINQTYQNIEFIVIDGLSNDNTINIINKYTAHISYFVSERDAGIFDAMNKAIDISTGDWLYFIGSDDYLYTNDVLTKIFNNDNSKYDIIIANTIWDKTKIQKSRIDYMILFLNTIHHQGAIYRRYLFDDFRYDKKYNVSSDYELNLIIYLRKHHYVYYDFIICCYSTYGTSGKSKFVGYRNEMRLRSRNIKNVPLKIALNIQTILRFCVKNIFYFFGIKLRYTN